MALGIVQTKFQLTASSSTPVVSALSALTGGSLLIVTVVGRGLSVTVTGVSDANNATYTSANVRQTHDLAGVEFWTEIWYKENAAGGATTITATLSGSSGDGYVGLTEVSGAATSSAIDAVSADVTDGAASTTPVGGSVTTTNAADILVGAIASLGGVSGMNGGDDFTSGGQDNGGVVITAGQAYAIKSSTGTYSPQWATGNATYCGSTAAFKAAAGGGVTPTGRASLLGVGR